MTVNDWCLSLGIYLLFQLHEVKKNVFCNNNTEDFFQLGNKSVLEVFMLDVRVCVCDFEHQF